MGIVFGTEHKGRIHKPAQEHEPSRRAIEGEGSGRLVQQRVETDAASLLVSGNVFPIHAGRQRIDLEEQLIDHGPSEETIQHDKLILIAVATAYFREIHSFDGSDNLLFDAELQMPHHLSRSEQSRDALFQGLIVA
jgi:hypothetical protein